MRMNTPKLLQRNLLTIIVLFGLVVIVTTVFSSLSLRTNLTNEFINRGTDIAAGIANTSTELMLNRDASTIQARIDSFLDPETGVAYIFVVNDEDEFISHTFVPEIPQELLDIVADETNQFAIQNLEIAGKGDFINITAPILAGTAGNVHVGMDLGIISERIQSVILNQIILVALVFVVSVFIAYIQTIRISRPLLQLTEYVQIVTSRGVSREEITQTEVELQPILQRNDEVGQLAQDFQIMVTEVRSYEQELEHRVAARTQDLNLSAEIGRQVTQAHNVDDVLVEATTLMKDQFGLYQVQIYLSDQERKNLVLRASDGHAGSQLLDAGHILSIDEHSLNGSAAYNNESVIVVDTSQSETFRPNPLLPDTRSETAVPLTIGTNVVGVLDLQSDKPNAFNEESLPAFITLAGQLAIAIENSNLFTEAAHQATRLSTLNEMSAAIATATDINEIYKVAGQYTQQIVGGQRASLGMLDPDGQTFEVLGLSGEKGVIPMNTHLPVGKTAVGLCLRENRLIIDADGKPEQFIDAKKLVEQGMVSTMTAPIIIGSKSIGTLNIASDKLNAFSTQEATLMQQIASLLGSAIENRQLLAQTENALTETSRQADRLSSLNEMSTAITTAADINEIYKIAGEYTQQIVGGQRASLGMLDPDGQTFEVMGLSGIKGAVPLGTHLPVDKTSVGLCIQERRLIIDGDGHPEKYVDNQKMAEQGLLSTISAPLNVSDKVIGTINVGSDQTNAFGTPEKSLMQQIASLLSGAIENRQLLAQTQEALTSMKTNESLMRTIIDSTPDWIFIKNTEHRYQLVNQSYAETMGLTTETFIGKNDLDIGFPEEIVKGNPEKGIRGFWTDDQEIMDKGEIKIIDEEPAIVDGETRVLNTIKVPLKDSKGNVTGIVGFVHDITAMKQAEATMEKQATELQTVADLSTAVSTTMDTQQLLQEVVNRTKESFNLYHAHIYLLDESDNTLLLTAGAGDVGIEMVSQGHNIRLDNEKSLIAQAARTKREVIVNDVSSDPAFLPNQLLPDTSSEMAVPMMVGKKVIGVLDVQSNEIGNFSETDANIQTTLATQIAVALENVRAYEQASELAAIIENTTSIIVTASLDQKIQYLNSAGLERLGYKTQEEILGKHNSILFPIEGAEEPRAVIMKTVQEEGLWQGESYLVTASGDTFPVDQTVTLLKTDEGFPRMLVFNMVDATEQREAELAQQALNAELEEQLERVNALQRAMTREGWQAFMTTTADQRPYQGFEFNQEGVKTLTSQEVPHDNNGKSTTNNESEVINPVTIQGTTIGKIGVRNPNGEPLTNEQRELLTNMTNQVAEALDRARLFEETELARSQTESLFSGSENVVQATTQKDILTALVQATALKNMERATLFFFEQAWQDKSPDSATVAATWQNENIDEIVPAGTTYPFDTYPLFRFLRREEPFVIEDFQSFPDLDENSRRLFVEGLGLRTAITIPLVVGDQWIGFALGLSSELAPLDNIELRQIISLASQAATVAQSQRLYNETQRRANREALVNEISQKIQNAPTVEKAMQTAVAELGKALGIQRAMVELKTNKDS